MATDTLHILLIEDSAAYARLIRNIFDEAPKGAFDLDRAATLKEGLERLHAGGIDAVLLDLTLPDCEGLDSFRNVRRAAPETPIIVLTGLDSGELAGTAVKEGAQDYLNKRDISANALLRCVRYAVDRRKAELELARARKMESIGQLAAGIAHEINTPIQYVGDSIGFLKEAFEDLARLRRDLFALCRVLESGGDPGVAMAQVARRRTEIEDDYLEEETPKAFERALDGVRRVGEVVRAMREFSHPSGKEKALADLNRAIENTLTIARSQYRYVANAVTELGDIPQVLCHAGEINQVLLNLVVNAAHAIEDAGKGSDELGTITVRSSLCGDSVRIDVADDGIGVSDEIRSRVFDPFFTTKEVGRGTGQGLALAHASIVKSHGGRLELESRPGKGATFSFILPIDGGEAPAQ